MDGAIEAVVVGRVGVDMYPAADQIEKPLHEIERFDRYVGGFAGNVSVGLARFGVSVAISSRVGDDGHGTFVRSFLKSEGVDVRWLATDPELRTALAFCEVWPPDRFPITFYRTPTCPDWRISREDLDLGAAASVPLLLATGTGLARSPSRETTLEIMGRHAEGTGTTIFDLDHRPTLWEVDADYALYAQTASRLAKIVVGNLDELCAATGSEDERSAALRLLSLGPELVVVKRGERGCALYQAGQDVVEVTGLDVRVLNGLGAGDAFLAAFVYGFLRGFSAIESARFGNAAGAIVASRISCSAAMPSEAEVRELLERHGAVS